MPSSILWNTGNVFFLMAFWYFTLQRLWIEATSHLNDISSLPKSALYVEGFYASNITLYKEIRVRDSVLHWVQTNQAKTTLIENINLVNLWPIGVPGLWSIEKSGEYNWLENYSLCLRHNALFISKTMMYK